MYQLGAKAYQTADAMVTDPKKLILMLYDGTIKALHHARSGIESGDIVARGEGLSKAIKYISELNASVHGQGEVPDFLRGLYAAILVELPKVNLTNDPKTLDRAIAYISKLRSIWQDYVMSDGRPENGRDSESKEHPQLSQRVHSEKLEETRHEHSISFRG